MWWFAEYRKTETCIECELRADNGAHTEKTWGYGPTAEMALESAMKTLTPKGREALKEFRKEHKLVQYGSGCPKYTAGKCYGVCYICGEYSNKK